MSENINKVSEILKNDTDLQKKYSEEIQRLAQSGEAATPDEAVVKAVKNVLDIDIELTELEKLIAQQEVVDPKDLEAIQGGEEENRDDYDWCKSNYACYIVYYHPDDAKPGEACYWDWTCFGIYNCVKGPN
ncbi:MAG: hypothetical protein K6A70_01850 [Erysipelotrichaceae bacterium]|nr:hypothetical protein [Erysipelotrichaceae bacterium]